MRELSGFRYLTEEGEEKGMGREGEGKGRGWKVWNGTQFLGTNESSAYSV